MKRVTLIFCLLAYSVLHAQTPAATEEPEKLDLTLQERFFIMKDKSESFKGYKVIRENVLDGVWKITGDSLKAQRASLNEARTTIKRLEDQLRASQETITAKDESVQAITYDSQHIRVLGIDFQKNVFITIVGIVLLVLVLVIGLIIARLKWNHSALKEKSDNFNALSVEYEEYKRKALDKQMKLSRELQDERNKLSEMRT